MRSRRGLARRGFAVIVSALCLIVALALVGLPSLLRSIVARTVATYVNADFSYDRIRSTGWTRLVIEAPALAVDDRVILAAERATLAFTVTGRDWSIASIRLDAPVLDLRREDLPRILRETSLDPVPWSLHVEVVNGRGRLLGEEFTALDGVAEIDGAGDDLRIDVGRLAGVVAGEPIEGHLLYRDERNATAAEAEFLVGRTTVQLAWMDSLAIRVDRPALGDLRRLAARVIERFPEVRSDSWAVTDLEALEHLSVTTDLAGHAVGLVTGLRHRAFDGELKRMGFAIQGDAVTLDSIVLVAMVKGETTLITSPEAIIEHGGILFPRLVAANSTLLVEGSNLRIAGNEMSAEIDRFEATLKEGRIAASGHLSGALASPGFDGSVRLSGIRFPRVAADLEMKAALSNLSERIAGTLDLTGGRLMIGGIPFRPAGARLLLDPDQLRFGTPLRLIAPGIEATLRGTLGLSGPLATMLGQLEWDAVATQFTLPSPAPDSVVVARLTGSGRGMNRWIVEATGLAAPGMTIETTTAQQAETGIDIRVGGLRRDEVTVSIGRIVIRNGMEIAEVSATGTLTAETIPFDLRIAENALSLALDEKTWSGPIRIRMEGDRLILVSDKIEGEGGSFTIAGAFFGPEGIRLASTFDARLGDVLSTRMREHLDLAHLDGRLRGEATWGETVSIHATFEDGTVEMRAGTRLTHLEGALEWTTTGRDPATGSTLRIVGLKGRTEGGAFEADGTLLLDGMTATRIEARWSSRDFALAALAGIDTRLKGLTGRADAEVTITGAWKTPEIQGYLDLRDLSVPVADLGILREAAGRIDFSNGGGVLRMSGLMGDGKIAAAGRIGGDATELTISLDHVPLKPVEGVDGRFTGDLILTRPFENRFHLRGTLAVENARVLTEHFAAPRNDPATAEESRLDLDLGIEIASIKLTGRDLLLAGKGRLAIRGTEIAPQVTGVIECDAGRLATRNAIFRIREARIFLPEHGEITVTAHAAARVDRIRIFADVNGPISEPRIVLTSSPEKSEAEIVTLLAIGREMSEEGVVTSMTDQRMAGLALPLANVAGGGIGGGFGLENFRLEKSGGDTGSALFDRVTIGGYVTDRVYLGYSQPTGIEAERRVEMEYEVSPELFIKFEAGDRGTAGAGLEWRRDY